MCARIDERFEFTQAMALSAEYGQFNHNALKKIYESYIDEVVSKKVGLEIYARGDLQALTANYDIFMHLSLIHISEPTRPY